MGIEKMTNRPGSERRGEQETCPTCQGSGNVQGSRCTRCNGTGKVRSAR